MPPDRVFPGQEHRIVTPADPGRADLLFQFQKIADAFLDRRHSRLYIPAIRGYGVLEVGTEAFRDPVQVIQYRPVVFGTKHHAVHFIRGQLIADDIVGKARVACKGIAFRKAFQQPGSIILYGVRTRSCVYYHALLPLAQRKGYHSCRSNYSIQKAGKIDAAAVFIKPRPHINADPVRCRRSGYYRIIKFFCVFKA